MQAWARPAGLTVSFCPVHKRVPSNCMLMWTELVLHVIATQIVQPQRAVQEASGRGVLFTGREAVLAADLPCAIPS